MSMYNVQSYTAQLAGIPFPGGQQIFVLLNVDPGTDELRSGDVLNFGANFSSDLTEQIQGFVAVCSISVFRQSDPNPWGFVETTLRGGENNNFILHSKPSNPGGKGSNKFQYFNTDLKYDYEENGTTQQAILAYGITGAGPYHSKDNFYTAPLIILRNARTDKYILMSSTVYGVASYDPDGINPGIINQNGIPVSLMGSTGHNAGNCTVSVRKEMEIDEITPKTLETDPYTSGGESGTGGGTGDFDGTGDDIDFPSLPTLSAVDTGFITLFNPSSGELKSLANYMWGDLFDIDTWKKIFADPMDAILGLSIVPVAVPNGGSKTVTVGNIPTGVTMNAAAAQYVEVDCGTLNVNEYWGAYLDYDPYTKAEIYLPYVGTHPLAVDDIMNKPVHVKYHVDILSGACCAYVKCGGSVLYSFVGQCSCSIPITGNDWTNVVNGALSIAASIGTMVATGGAAAPMAVTEIASTAVNSMKPTVEKSGSMGGMGGMLGVQTPYLILTRPRQARPTNQNMFSGYPSFITEYLGSIHGYTEIESIHLDGVPATELELSEIETLLKGGVIF